jgi:sterol 3beta-glucosyltransferase
MQALIAADGTRGDVQPLLAVGIGLAAAGYRVAVLTSRPHADAARACGFEVLDVGTDPVAASRTGINSRLRASPLRAVRYLTALLRGRVVPSDEYLGRLRAAVEGADVVVASHLMGPVLYAAEAAGVPGFLTRLVPYYRTAAFPFPVGPLWAQRLRLGRAWNWSTHVAAESLFGRANRRWVDEWRTQALGLAPLGAGGDRHPVLYGFSPSFIRKPGDWPPWHHVTGFWFLPAAGRWSPPSGLADFLASGPPPVYVGFGSSPVPDPRLWDRDVVPAVRRHRRRLLIGAGWSDPEVRPADDVYVLRDAPFEWLFPRVAAVVHHAGVGTCAEVLRAGRPSVAVPLIGEQRFLAARMERLRVSPPPVPMHRLSRTTLVGALGRALSDRSLRDRAARLGEAIRAEDGVGAAVRLIDAAVARRPAGRGAGRLPCPTPSAS